MKLINGMIMLISVMLSGTLLARDLQVFSIYHIPINANKAVGFISLSDIYVMSEHPDSLAMPDAKAKGIDSARCFTLSAEYRKRFLRGTGISESDTVFIYDYAKDVSASFPVKDLPVVARINIYAGQNDSVFAQHDYMFGFSIDALRLKNMSRHYITTLVSVGKQYPFVRKQMKPMEWKRIDYKVIPFSSRYLNDMPWLSRYTAGNTYQYETDKYRYLVQDIIQMDMVHGRHLLIMDLKTNESVCERIYLDGEGTSLAPLNNISPEYGNMTDQWTGNLFKNKAPIVFGFLYQSFGCPAITFLDHSETDLYIGCDNRH